MICLRNVSVDTLNKGDTEDDDNDDDDDDDDNDDIIIIIISFNYKWAVARWQWL
jgi:hypothetical protein